MKQDDAQLDFHFDRLEPWGISLVQRMISRFRSSGSLAPGFPIPEGPHFVYERTPSLFQGRSGRGPLRIAWDTNLLVDYFDHGARLWEGQGLPVDNEDIYGIELEGLQVLVAVWVLRDVEFVILASSLSDSKRKELSAERSGARRIAMRSFEDALAHSSGSRYSGDRPSGVWSDLPLSARLRVLREIPKGYDRILVEAALDRSVHVFLTRDLGILRSQALFRPLGLLLASPQEMVEELGATGALHAFFEPSCLYWPLPDQARVAHLITALGVGNLPDEQFRS